MKVTRSLQLILLLPTLIVGVFAVLVIYGALGSVKQQFSLASEELSADLDVIADAAGFSHDLASIQQQMMQGLHQAEAGEASELQLYRMHSRIVDELDELGKRLALLAGSELVIDANHNSAQGLVDEFTAYQRFVIMSTDVLAVDPRVAHQLLDQAHEHYRHFSMLANRIVGLLAERADQRNTRQKQVFEQVLVEVLVLGLLALSVLLLLAFFIARRASGRMLDVAEALSNLARNPETCIALPRIERMQASQHGEFGRIARTLLTFRDAIERQRKAEQEAFQLSYYDPLTRLPNRRLLDERVKRALSLGQQLQGNSAMLVLDLDNFKTLNDTRGHKAGDELLVTVAQSLQAALSDSDTVARLGGDEFAILLESLSGKEHQAAAAAERQAEKLLAVVADPVLIDGEWVFISASIGISLFNSRLRDQQEPLQFAEAAMYQAKSQGRNTFCFHDPHVQGQLQARMQLETELRQALERGQLQLHYQVQVNDHEQVQGLEALLRWQHPQRGSVPPAEFIPLAEESDLIVQLGNWVLQSACAQLAAWADHPQRRQWSLSVNVSPRQFREPRFVQQVRDALAISGANPRRLKLELTESTVLEDIDATIARMHQLRTLGLRFSIDDFGTGYSSLQYLKRLPLDQLKIDQSFVRDINSDDEDEAIVQAIIVMGQALGLEVIAEGVETPEQRAFLRKQGCLLYQGYLFGRPVPAGQLPA